MSRKPSSGVAIRRAYQAKPATKKQQAHSGYLIQHKSTVIANYTLINKVSNA